MNPRFAFIDLADRFCTGSSIMPQKKNPDVPELIRAKTGRINGNLVALLTLMKAQPLAYNKDNQEDKEPLFDTVDTLTASLRVFAELLGGIKVNAEAMRRAALEGYATATDLADYLVKKGAPFREAHEAVAQAVRFAEGRGCDLAGLTLAELQQFSPLIGADVFAALTLEGALKARSHIGGTARPGHRRSPKPERRCRNLAVSNRRFLPDGEAGGGENYDSQRTTHPNLPSRGRVLDSCDRVLKLRP